MVLVAISSIIFASANTAEAQLGKYQRGMAKAVVGGGSTGYEYGGATGAVMGGIVGGAYYDHQHNSSKVHNSRTPRVGWNQFNYAGGAFVRRGNSWIEYQNGRPAFQFIEAARAPSFIDLYDPSRRLTVRIEGDRALIQAAGRPWQLLYSGRSY
jgi:hypothetical protein